MASTRLNPPTSASKAKYDTFGGLSLSTSSPKRFTWSNASWPSRLLFRFVDPMIALGASRQLHDDDMWDLDDANHAETAAGHFKACYDAQTRSLPRAIAQAYGGMFLLSAASELATTGYNLLAPVVLQHLIDSFGAPLEQSYTWVGWVAVFVVARFANVFLSTSTGFQFDQVVLRLTLAIKALLFEKALRLAPRTGGPASEGEPAVADLTNMYSSDVSQLLAAAQMLNKLLVLPIQVAVAAYMLFDLLGVAALAGIVVVLLSMGLGVAIANASGRLFGTIMSHKDDRAKAVKEIFGKMAFVKLNALERASSARIFRLRGVEFDAIRRYTVVQTLVLALPVAMMVAVSVVSFGVYTLLPSSQPLTAARVFSSLALFDAISTPMRVIPQVYQFCLQGKISLGRVATFLDQKEHKRHASVPGVGKSAIAVESADFAWSTDGRAPVLKDVTLSAQRGELVVVHGAVGAGKSSLCLALLGEMDTVSGEVAVNGRIAYHSQQPWIQNASVRDNIVFGYAFDQHKYDTVVDACCLLPDIEQLPAGDDTEIGAQGVNLSEGQKARLSLARACYSDADVFVLDSPLAAVDGIVQAHIFRECICGILASKTVVMVTHRHELITSDMADATVLVEGGSVTVTRRSPALGGARVVAPRRLNALSRLDTTVDHESQHHSAPRHVREQSKAVDERSPRGKLVMEETREDGRVSWSVFKAYFHSLGGLKIAAMLVAIQLAAQGCAIGSDLWLNHWTSLPDDVLAHDKSLNRHEMAIYAVIGLAAALVLVLRSVTVALVCLRASRKLFESMTGSLLAAPLRFFDANPIGRIVTRYGADMTEVDFSLPRAFGAIFNNLFSILCKLATTVYAANGLALLVAPLLVVYVKVANLYIISSRELSRLWKTSSSPIQSYVTEAEQGVAVIRAFGDDAIQRAIRGHYDRNDTNSKVWYAETAMRQWFELRMKLIGSGVIVIVVASLAYMRASLPLGFVGIAFTYTLSVDGSITGLVHIWSWLESTMVSPERILEYSSIHAEDADQALVLQPSLAWPHNGVVVFDSVVFNYKPGDAPVLKGVSFAVNAREKVGIVGRTGAGKSSLIMALFRINSLSGGRILLDGVDIATVPLQTLRSRLAIIPQSPVLFKGELREYMDPFGDFSDVEIWRALDKVGMTVRLQALVDTAATTAAAATTTTGASTTTTTVEATTTTATTDTSACLRVEVSENGDNFSVGERQLLCMARALLTKSRVVVLDEATASVDRATETQVQAMLARDFRDATVLTIAHRLATVVASDRIVVMRGGQVAEMGPPRELAADRSGEFHRLAKEAGCLDGLLA